MKALLRSLHLKAQFHGSLSGLLLNVALWAAWLVFGGIFVLAGGLLFAQRSARPTSGPDAPPRER